MDVIFSEQEIALRIKELGAEITEFYRNKPLLVVAVANGAILFASDLMRKIDVDLEMDTIAVASYVGDHSTGRITFRSPGKISPAGKHVLLIDDVLDSGVTLRCLKEYFMEHGALSCRTAVAVSKDVRRSPNGVSCADWFAFTAPDRYLVGYGMDSREFYRNLPFIGAIR